MRARCFAGMAWHKNQQRLQKEALFDSLSKVYEDCDMPSGLRTSHKAFPAALKILGNPERRLGMSQFPSKMF